ncbi:integrase arm-type DNA-binding domain-containing protein [Rheinheimera sp. UJ51]|uniref:tyrosine-type recombinase/integrase n=1 Tax=Rheinheimera sp. UJ51 TaxID=2892446 RepID=UPI001E405A19|nr:integrase arm-type DNA-binding domain-containing protein [Rheinheimera sp. UJ51]MCC5451693.1 integrase arm-type DNA-binding domain-containing protein [Rheinheimera sp. UJ51]
MALTALQVEKAKQQEKDYKLSDGSGLYLLVKKNGSKYWRLKYRFTNKERLLSIGVYPDISLKDARLARDEARRQLAQGIDPSAEKQARKLAGNIAAANSFEAIGREWLDIKISDKSKSYQVRTKAALVNDLFPYIGKKPITEISALDLLGALRRIENRGAIETAHRAKQTAGQVFRYAIATGRADRDISADLKGALKTPVSKHFPSITDPTEVGRLLIAIDGYTGTKTVKAALLLSPLLFCRPGEIRHLEWSEIDFENARIEIPAEKMKMREAHIIPLSKQAQAILEEIHYVTGQFKFVFPSQRGPSRPLSDNGVRTALRTLGYDNETMTPHGFRAMARTLLDEVLGYRIEWIEQQLAHAVKDANGRAYNRTKHLPQRTEMMQRWADYLDTLRTSATNNNVIPAKFGNRG